MPEKDQRSSETTPYVLSSADEEEIDRLMRAQDPSFSGESEAALRAWVVAAYLAGKKAAETEALADHQKVIDGIRQAGAAVIPPSNSKGRFTDVFSR